MKEEGATVRAARKSVTFANLAIALLATAVVLLVALHGLKSDYDISSYMISDYAVGQYGRVMTVTFLTWGAGLLALTVGLLLSERSTWDRRIGAALLFVTSAGLVVSGVYPTDLPGMPDTPDGKIHYISFLVNVFSLLAAIPLVSFGLRSTAWRPFRATALTLSLLVVLSFALQFATLHKGMPYGITNRIFVAMLFTWMIATAVRLRSLPMHGAR